MASGSESDGAAWWAVFSAFGGAIIGSVLGGLISYWLQEQSLAATKAIHDADRHDVRKALGYGLLFKLIRMCSDFPQLGGPATLAMKKARDEGHFGWLWPLVLPIVPLPEPIKFLAEEMALVLSLDDKLFNDMAALDDLHKSTVAIFELYANKRGQLTDTLVPETMEGNKGGMLLSAEEKARLQGPSVELDMLVEAMVERTHQDGRQAWDCLKRLHAVLEEEFDLKHKLQLKKEYQDFYSLGTQPFFHHYKS